MSWRRGFWALVLPGLLIACGGESGQTRGAGRPETNVVLVVVDTLRADRLASYGHGHDTAPFVSELAERGVLFERAYAASSWTATSMASIFTSTYPNQHQVLSGLVLTRRNAGKKVRANRIPDELPTLPEILRRAGYRTFAIADNINIDERMGFARGFDHFVSHRYEGAPTVNAGVAAILPELTEPNEAPYFLYLHYMDPHQPYRKRRAHYDEAASGGELFAAYDSEIGYFDEHLRRVFEHLRIGPDTLVVLTSDHGEEFFEHGGEGHKIKMYDELLHVPLVFTWPDRLAPRRVSANVTNIDLVPTILDLLGIAPMGHEVGISLVDLMEGHPGEERTLFAMRWQEMRDPQLMRKAVISGDWKYIWSRPGDDRELYDRGTDPGELENLEGDHPEIVIDLHDRLLDFEENAPVYERAYGRGQTMDAEMAEKLRSLGYVE